MWTRAQLKDKAKVALRRNYWKTVLVALILVFTVGGNAVARVSDRWDSSHEKPVITYDDGLTGGELSLLLNDPDAAEKLVEDYGDEDGVVDEDDIPDSLRVLLQIHSDEAGASYVGESDDGSFAHVPFIGGLTLALVGLVGMVLSVVASAVAVFLLNPLNVGTRRFFSRNLNQPAEVREVMWAFDHNYLETVKTMFWRDAYTVLWSLLLVVPGIVKLYEYRMIPYLLAEDPAMTKERAFAESRRLMDGYKWRAFVLDCSFIGWGLLSVVTLGTVAVFYAAPYKDMTDAALYEALRYERPALGPGAAYGTSAGSEASAPVMDVPVPPFAASDAPAPREGDAPEA